MKLEFDYVIVGSGSAGSVLANRLSAGGRFRVLVLEAGGSDRRFWIQTPIGYGKTFFDPAVNWMYQTEPDPGINHRSSYWPRGKVMGGSSSINAMVYIRGQQQDFNDWEAAGNPGWGWQDVLPYFIKSETNSDGANEFRGDQGPLYVNNVSDQYHPLCQKFFEASRQFGFSYNPDFNGEDQEGVGAYQITARNGRRMSAARAYLHPALKRRNCEILTHALVTRINFNGSQAESVDFEYKGKACNVKASQEIILSAGAINSPQILQLSGIGDSERLKAMDIPCISHSPAVGQNLQDHLDYCVHYRSRVPTLNNQIHPWWGKLMAGMQYLLTRRGLLSLSVNQAGGFVRSHPSRPRPNMQMYFAAITSTTSGEGERPLMSPDPFPGFLNSIGQIRPTSRGQLHIRSNNPRDPVSIHPNYLSTEEDQTQMLEGVRMLRELGKMPALADLIEGETTDLPGDSDDELLDDIRNRVSTVFHPSCTCRMGPEPDSAVVDNHCQVYGTSGLRVVDTSVFPTVTSGNTNAPTIMVAEKAADLILNTRESSR